MFGLMCLLVVGGAAGFSVTKTEPKEIRVKLGEPFTIMCQVDGWYEVGTTTKVKYKRPIYFNFTKLSLFFRHLTIVGFHPLSTPAWNLRSILLESNTMQTNLVFSDPSCVKLQYLRIFMETIIFSGAPSNMMPPSVRLSGSTRRTMSPWESVRTMKTEQSLR